MNDFRSPTGIAWNPGGLSGLVQYGNDDNTLVVFYNKAIQNMPKSIQAGRVIKEDQVYVKIQHPGEMLNIIDRPCTDEDKMRYGKQWSAFLHNRTIIPEGTPIDLLFPNYPAVADNLRAWGVHTIEQCSELSAHAIDNIGRGAQEYVNKAKKYISSSNSGAGFHMMQKQLDEERQKNRVMAQQMAVMKDQLDRLMMRDNNPMGASLQPGFIPGYDAQSARLNANHPTKEVAEKASKTRRRNVTLDPPAELSDQQAEENAQN